MGRFGTAFFPLLKYHGQTVVHQFNDLNSDGLWDELLLQLSVKPYSTDTLNIKWVKKTQLPQYNPGANVRFSCTSTNGQPAKEILEAKRLRGFTQNIEAPFYQLEGPGIENDKVAFRAFFDMRNGKDIYGKVVDTMILDRVGLTGSWHQLQNWGMDIFKSGNSLGAGGLGVKENSKIYRLADADTSSFNFITEGPLQASFKLSFKNWDVGNRKGNGSETISINKGDFFIEDEVSFPYHRNQTFIVGLGTIGINEFEFKKLNAKISTIFTYGQQVPGDTEPLGVAILFPAADYYNTAKTQTADSIPNSCYVQLKNRPGKKIIYLVAGWARSEKKFGKKKGFINYLQLTANRLAYPLQLKFIRS